MSCYTNIWKFWFRNSSRSRNEEGIHVAAGVLTSLSHVAHVEIPCEDFGHDATFSHTGSMVAAAGGNVRREV